MSNIVFVVVGLILAIGGALDAVFVNHHRPYCLPTVGPDGVLQPCVVSEASLAAWQFGYVPDILLLGVGIALIVSGVVQAFARRRVPRTDD